MSRSRISPWCGGTMTSMRTVIPARETLPSSSRSRRAACSGIGERSAIYARAGIPAYWIINLVDRQLESHSRPTGGQSSPTVLGVADSVELIIEGHVTGQIAVADVLPKPWQDRSCAFWGGCQGELTSPNADHGFHRLFKYLMSS